MSRLAGVRPLLAPAKLNLFLHVLGRRADGYHELESVFVPLDLADTLHLWLRDDGAVVREAGAEGVAEADDLVVRAARLLAEAGGVREGVTIRVDKRIPMGGGLGGGSSDAASTLMALNRLWRLHWSRDRLARLALSLGADVPFFLVGAPADARGVGEALRPLPAAALRALPSHVVVVAPPVQVPTASVFGAAELTRDTKPLKISGLSRGRLGEALPGRNDLEPVVLARHPQVAAARQALVAAMGAAGQSPGLVRMTGSGACVFAALSSARSAQAVAAGARQAGVGDVVSARVLPGHALTRWAFAS